MKANELKKLLEEGALSKYKNLYTNIEKQTEQVRRFRAMEELPLPKDFDYMTLDGLRLEARQKLNAQRPMNLGQASRISGVSPADVGVLLVFLKRGVPHA